MSRTEQHRVRDGVRVIAPFAVAVASLRADLRRAGPRRRPGRGQGDRLLGDDLRRLGPVRRDLGPLRGRDAGRGHRRRGAAQHALRADRAVGGAGAARAGVEAWPARPARRRRVVGREPPRRRALRRPAAARRRAHPVLRMGGRHDASAAWPGRCSAIPRRSGSTRPSRRSSSRCSPARCAGASARSRRSAGPRWRRRSSPSSRPASRSWPPRSSASSACAGHRGEARS